MGRLRHVQALLSATRSGYLRYTLQGGSDRRNIEPQYVHFGIG